MTIFSGTIYSLSFITVSAGHLKLVASDLPRGGQHADYQPKATYPGLEFGTRTRLKTFILRDLSATMVVIRNPFVE